MRSAEDYRRKAAQLRDRAEKAGSPEIKEQFKQIARQYEGLAADVQSIQRAKAELQRSR